MYQKLYSSTKSTEKEKAKDNICLHYLDLFNAKGTRNVCFLFKGHTKQAQSLSHFQDLRKFSAVKLAFQNTTHTIHQLCICNAYRFWVLQIRKELYFLTFFW